ncbi:hypothetical protein BJV74DRAFT_916837 [Russula compacta]|nr:hypothetical protein BJV74DRAFT_916837 [Russula compacta]
MTFLLFLTLLLSSGAIAQQTLFPPAVPLAVRSPYLNCWLNPTNEDIFRQLWQWPTTYNTSQSLGWSVSVRVDGLAYSFLGATPNLNATANMTSIVVTPTQTTLTSQAGPMEFNLTFLNPIEPGDWVKQSIPFSYVALNAKSLDGKAHATQVYSDVSGEWSSGDRNQVIQWSTTSNSDVIYHSVRLLTPTDFEEISNQAEWGTLYYAMKAGNNVTHKIAEDVVSRGQFLDNGVLDNQTDSNFRDISVQFPVFGISRDLGTIQATQAPVVWSVGYTTDPAINYTDLSGAPPTPRSLYYKSQYSDDESLIVDFLNNFNNASLSAQRLNQKILQDAASVSNLLGDLVSLSIAQVYGSTQLTIGTNSLSNFSKSDVMMFMKNIGGKASNRVNAVETLYSAFPALMYIDPSLGAPLLEPLFRLQASPYYSIPYATADLGSSYPNVTGSNSNHDQGVEQSGNMLIMTYAYARASGDGSLISRYYSLLTSWADYLMHSTLSNNQSSADGSSAINQTNLAIKGIIAIQAMSKMSSVVKQATDADTYSKAAGKLYGQWKNLALSSDQHLLAVYQQNDSWTLGYNLFADVWLGTNLVDSSVYNGQSNFIDNITSTSTFSNFGMPIDNVGFDTNTVVSGWNLFVAGMTPDGDLRSNLISRVHERASFNISAGAFPLNYDSSSGNTLGGAASPAQGAMFAPLALKAPVLTINPNGTPMKKTSSGPRSHTGEIVGAIIGGGAAISLAIGAAAFIRRRRRQKRRKSISSFLSDSLEPGPPATVTPFDSIPLVETYQDQGLWLEQQQLLPEPPEAEIVPDPHGLSSTPPSTLPRSGPVAPVPPGMSGKEIARLRAEVLSWPSNGSQSQSSPSPITEQSGVRSSSDTRRLQSEVESLRREMQELRTERLEAPPSYTEGGSGSSS